MNGIAGVIYALALSVSSLFLFKNGEIPCCPGEEKCFEDGPHGLF
jgi:hypothetical protein